MLRFYEEEEGPDVSDKACDLKEEKNLKKSRPRFILISQIFKSPTYEKKKLMKSRKSVVPCTI